jgi:hypothetical protein
MFYFFSSTKHSNQTKEDAACAEDLQILLKDSFVVGELHPDITPKKFLISNMAALHEAGFTTLFLEGLPVSIQGKLDRFILGSELELDIDVQMMLAEMDKCLPFKAIKEKVLESMEEDSEYKPLKETRAQLDSISTEGDGTEHINEVLKNVEKTLIRFSKLERLAIAQRYGEVHPLIKSLMENNYTQLVFAAKQYGIRVVAIDDQDMLDEYRELRKLPYSEENGFAQFLDKRIREGNELFASVIQSIPPEEKWVALIGEEHAKTSQYRGIAARFNVGAVYFDGLNNNETFSIEYLNEPSSSTKQKPRSFLIKTTPEYLVPRFHFLFSKEVAFRVSDLSNKALQKISQGLLYVGERTSTNTFFGRFLSIACTIDDFVFRSRFIQWLDQRMIENFFAKNEENTGHAEYKLKKAG